MPEPLWICPKCGREHPAFRRVEVFSPRNVLHAFRLTGPDDVDEAFTRLLHEAYGVGEQRHLSL